MVRIVLTIRNIFWWHVQSLKYQTWYFQQTCLHLLFQLYKALYSLEHFPIYAVSRRWIFKLFSSRFSSLFSGFSSAGHRKKSRRAYVQITKQMFLTSQKNGKIFIQNLPVFAFHQTCFVFHLPILKSIPAKIARTEKAIVIAQKTPSGPKSILYER